MKTMHRVTMAYAIEIIRFVRGNYYASVGIHGFGRGQRKYFT